MNANNLAAERKRLGQVALDFIRERGAEPSAEALAHEAGISRVRLDSIFADEADMFDAVCEVWFDPKIAIMEEVLASDLPVNRKMYEFFARRFVLERSIFREDPGYFRVVCELGARRFERVRSFIDLADHYTCELIAQAQAEGYFEGLSIDRALTLVNQMVIAYTMPDILIMICDRLSEDKLAAIVDTMFAGLSARDGGAKGVRDLRAA